MNGVFRVAVAFPSLRENISGWKVSRKDAKRAKDANGHKWHVSIVAPLHRGEKHPGGWRISRNERNETQRTQRNCNSELRKEISSQRRDRGVRGSVASLREMSLAKARLMLKKDIDQTSRSWRLPFVAGKIVPVEESPATSATKRNERNATANQNFEK
jgi:hypothetical protein